jgi:hypothetical protein
MIKKIVAYGCSHTYGHGLGDEIRSGTESNEQASKSSWPNHIFQNFDVVNLASNGNNNEAIYRHLLNTIEDHKENSLVAVMFSYIERLQKFRSGHVLHVTPSSITFDHSNPIDCLLNSKIIDKREQEFLKFQEDLYKITDESDMYFKYLSSIFNCQILLEQKQIPYIFTTVKNVKPPQYYGAAKEVIQTLEKSINWNKFYLIKDSDGAFGFGEYGHNTNAERANDGMHFAEKFHMKFAQMLAKEITRIYPDINV